MRFYVESFCTVFRCVLKTTLKAFLCNEVLNSDSYWEHNSSNNKTKNKQTEKNCNILSRHKIQGKGTRLPVHANTAFYYLTDPKTNYRLPVQTKSHLCIQRKLPETFVLSLSKSINTDDSSTNRVKECLIITGLNQLKSKRWLFT